MQTGINNDVLLLSAAPDMLAVILHTKLFLEWETYLLAWLYATWHYGG